MLLTVAWLIFRNVMNPCEVKGCQDLISTVYKFTNLNPHSGNRTV